MISPYMNGVLAGRWISLILQGGTWEEAQALFEDNSCFTENNPCVSSDFLRWLDQDTRRRQALGIFLLSHSLLMRPEDRSLLGEYTYFSTKEWEEHSQSIQKDTLIRAHKRISSLVKIFGGQKLLESHGAYSQAMKKQLRLQNRLLMQTVKVSLRGDDKKIASLLGLNKSQVKEAYHNIQGYYKISPGV